MIGLNKKDPLGEGQCPSIHVWSDQRCVRKAGHTKRCRGKAHVHREGGTITTTYWISENGKFSIHGGYKTIYPTNMVANK